MKAKIFIFLFLNRWSHHASSSTIEGDGDNLETAEFTLDLTLPTNVCDDGLCNSDEDALSCPTDCSNLELTTAHIGGDMASVGLVFSVKAFRNVVITSIDIFTQSTAVQELVQLYTHVGEYSRYEMPGEEWEVAYDNPALDLLGRYTPTTLADLNVSIKAGMVTSFLLHTPNMILCIEDSTNQWNVSASDNILEVYDGVGLSDKLPDAGLFSSELPRTFTGTVRYNVSGSDPSDVISAQVTTSNPQSDVISAQVTTFNPTSKSPTKIPTKAPTRSPTSNPTSKQPTKIPTRAPTKIPTSKPSKSPTKFPTLKPTSLIKKISFVAFGDIPYTKNHRYCLNKHLRKLNQAQMGFKFMVHIGDIKQGTTSCYESSFSDIADMFSHPTNAIGYDTEDCFFVPGDNEFQDCQDRAQAWRWWMKYFGNGSTPNSRGFGTLSDPSIVVNYEQKALLPNNDYPTSAGNFAFYTSNVLFLGINQVGGGTVGDESTRVQGNYKWVESNMAKYSSQGMRAVVVFAHASMISTRSQYFGTPFMTLLRQKYSGVKVLYLHGDGHNYRSYRTDSNNLNLYNVEVEGGEEADPLLISVMYDATTNVYSFNIDARGGYYSSGCVAGNVDKTWSSNY